MFPKRSRGLFGPVLALIALLTALSPAVRAHPLGNYSINQYTIFDLRGEGITIHYMLDIAEIPTFREMDLLDTNMDNDITGDEIDAYMEKRVPEYVGNLSLTLDGKPLPLRLREQRLEVYSGSAEMPIFNVFLELEVVDWRWPAQSESLTFDYRSKNSENARGYRESNIVVDGRYEVGVGPWDDKELKYQTLILKDDHGNPLFQSFYNRFLVELSPGSGDMLAALPAEPDFTWTATARSAEEEYTLLAKGGKTFAPGESPTPTQVAAAEPVKPPVTGAAAPTPQPDDTVSATAAAPVEPKVTRVRPTRTPEPTNSETAEHLLTRVSNIISTKELTLPMVGFALGIALLLGMGHAFSPGHGKTVMAAYLIGERGTVRHAIALGIIVTITHVWSVLLLGMVTLYAGERFTEDQVTFWTGVASGLIIVIIDMLLFVQRYSAFVLARHQGGHTHDDAHHLHDHSHSHDHEEHDHSHDHGHSHDHEHGHVHKHGLFGKSHSHVIEAEDGAPPTYKNIVWLGISGGIVPCPAALIVLLLAIKFGRLQLGLILITAFSVGLAAVLVAIGIAVVKASGEVRKRIGGRSPILLALPVVSSVLITILGLWLIFWTLIQFNVIVITPIA